MIKDTGLSQRNTPEELAASGRETVGRAPHPYGKEHAAA